MILTCPACDTKYVVKDGAIPAAGRQVRCASCKHSWHQDPEPGLAEQESVAVDFGGPPPPMAEEPGEAVADVPEQAEVEAMIADAPEPVVEEQADDGWTVPMVPEPEDSGHDAELAEYEEVHEPGPEVQAEEPREWQAPEPTDRQPQQPVEEEFVGYSPIGGDEESGRRWPMLLGLLLLIAAAAAAFWFLAPPEWKARAGIAGAGATPLQLMITTSDRQPLESGNELVAISGRVINPTDVEQNVPPIRAELRDKQTNAVVHRWTIAPPARVLAPRSSASFNSAEVDVPKGGDELTVTLGG